MLCPVCKEEMPLLSRVCPVCGHVLDGGENRMTASDTVACLEQMLHDVKALPEPSFVKSMGQFSIFMVPLLTLLLFALYLMSSAGLFLLVGAVFAVWSVVLITKKMAGRLGNTHADRKFAELKNDYEQLVRTAQRDYGKNREMAALLEEINMQFGKVESKRKAQARKNLLLWAVIVGIVVILSSVGTCGVKEQVAETTKSAKAAWIEALEQFKAAGVNDEYDAEARTQVLRAVLDAGEVAEAERFFRDYCMGLMGDTECAKQIVTYHLGKGNAEAATAFVEQCKLRYESDVTKLKNLIKR